MDINADGRVCKQTLTLTGSTAALIAAMHAFNNVEGIRDVSTGNAASTPTGAGTPSPMPLPSAPGGAVLTPIAPMPSMSNVSTDADEGDGSGVDADGLPWDERIHSSNKLKSANGKWQSRRGGPKGDERAAIEAELRGSAETVTMPGAAPAVLASPMPAPPPLAPVPEPLAPPAAVQPPPLPVPAPIAAPAPAPQPMPAPAPAPMPVAEVQPAPTPLPTPAPVAAAAPAEWDFASFMHAVGPKMGEGAGMIDATYLAAVCAHYGLNAITDLAPKPEMIGQIVAQFTADGRW